MPRIRMERETKTAAKLEAMIMQLAGEATDCDEVKALAVKSSEIGCRVLAIVRGRMMAIKPSMIRR